MKNQKELNYLTIEEAHKSLTTGEITSVDLVKACLKRIKDVDPKIKAFTSIFENEALKKAEEADALIKKGKGTELTGIPFALKNNYATEGQSTRASSKLLEDYKAPYEGTVVKRLHDSGAVLIGKTNCDAYGFGVSTLNSGYGPSHNPWDLERTPGGSTGGLGAALAAGCIIFGIGEDTGGSVRNPGALCGVTALKPTYGLLSRYGIFAMACSFDCPGPMARSVKDISYILKYTSGKDEMDSQTVESDEKNYDLSDKISKKVKKIGVPKQFMTDEVDKGTKKRIKEALEVYKDKGYEVQEVDLPHAKHAIEVYYVLVPGEISSNQALYDGIRFCRPEGDYKKYEDVYFNTKTKGFEDEVKRRIMIGTYALSRDTYKEYYEKAAKVRSLVIQDLKKAFNKVDILIGPTSPNTAWRLDEKLDPVKMYLMDIFTVVASCAGVPALSIPVGFDEGLPVGMQIISPSLSEKELLSFARVYQNSTNWHTKRPKI